MDAKWLGRTMQHRVWIRVVLGLLIVLAALWVVGPRTAHAEGTVDLYENYDTDAECPLDDAYDCPRGLIEWRNNVWGKDNITGPTGWDHTGTPALVDGMAFRRTFFRVHALSGERILMGSSAMFNDMNDNNTECLNLPDLSDSGTNTGDCASDIVVYTEAQINGLTGGSQAAPQDISALTPAFSCRNAGTASGGRGSWVTDSYRGVLINTNQETNGPVADPLPTATTWNASYYNPCAYSVTADGIYYVAFYGVGGSVSTDSGATNHVSYDARRCTNLSDCDTGQNPPAGQLGAGTIASPVVTGACATAGSCYSGNTTWQLNGVSMMDITVRTAAGANQTGRVWTEYLSQYIGQNGTTYAIFERFLTTTSDGFKYQVDTNGLDGNGWTFYGNSQGFLYPDGVTTLYHDAVTPTSGTGADTMYVWNPAGGVLMQRANAKTWFNTPAVPTSIVPVPVVPSISDPDFSGTYGLWEDGTPTSYYQTGGTFGFTSNVVGQATIIIVPNPGANAAACAGAVYDGGLTTNRMLTVNITTPGTNTFTWDGKDNAGGWFATSYPDNDTTPGYCYQVSLRSGEYHFPMIDIESSTRGGPIFTLLPPASNPTCPFTNCRWAFYDDRTYVTSGGNVVPDLFNSSSFTANILLPCGYDNFNGGACSGTKPSPIHTSVDGYDTATSARGFGGNYSDDYPWGNQKALDVWTYWPSNLIYGLVYIVPTDASNTAAIGNYVWLDEDGDGDQDAGEAGIPNVKVTITKGTQTYTTYTDANGGYLFTGLSAGAWTVTVDSTTLPAGLNQTYDENGVGTPHTTSVALAAGLEYLTADFGYNWSTTTETNSPAAGSTGAIGDRVWVDVDGDGKQDPEEVGVEGVTVQLTGPGADGILGTVDDTTATTTTNVNGNYIFDGLAAGAYTVTVTDTNNKLNGYSQTGDPDHFAAGGGTNDARTTTPVVLGPGDVFVNADFGYQPVSAVVGLIGDTVWFDADADGCGPQIGGVIQGRSTCTVADASEYGIPGVTVALIKDDGDGVYEPGIDKIIATDITDASGQYLFSGLLTGSAADYLVWVNDTDNVLGELVQSYDNNGTASPNVSAALDLIAAGNRLQDFGYTARGQNTGEGMLGDYVYFDRNGDGTYDADGVDNVLGTGDDENGIEGVIVELRNSTGGLIATTRTDENGYYSFGNLTHTATTTYQVWITNTGNFGTSGNAGSMGALYGMTYSDDPDSGTANGQASVSLAAGAINLNQDFGLKASSTLGSIGNLVWNDVNADGNVDTGEAGIAGVTVDLYRDLDGDGKIDPGEPRVDTATTDANGAYSFTGLSTADNGLGAAGADYVVDVTDNAGVLMGYWQSYGTTATNDNSQVDPYAVSISTGSPNNVTADFGYYVLPGAVGNYVWEDLDADGIQDAGEPGIPGVEVVLAITWPNSAGTTTLKTTTAADGSYSFGNLLQDEDYNGTTADGSTEPVFTISVATPVGYVSTYDGTPDAAGIGNGTDANADNQAGELGYPPEGGVDNTNDFGFYRAGSIGNYVWLDEDGDGDQDAGEAGIPNVKVSVTNGTQTYTTYTDANGGYLFTNLRPGAWTVTVDESTLPAGLAANNTYNEDTGTTNPDNVTTVNLSAGEEHLTADFGYNWSSTDETNDPDPGENATGAIGDRVWVDLDPDGAGSKLPNGIQDLGEIGIQGVEVQLWYDSNNDGTIDAKYGSSVYTDANGNYIFDGLPKGIYEVRIPAPPSGYTQTGDPDSFGSNCGAACDNKTTTPIVLGPGDVFLNADFGYTPASVTTGSIGDTVWFDPDGDAVVDAGEYGIPGVTVALIKDDGDGVYEPGTDMIIATDITDANGNYLFAGLPVTDGDGTDDYLVWVNDTNHVLGELAPVYDKDGIATPNISAVLNLGTTGTSPYGTNTVTDQDFGYAPRGHTAAEGLIGDYVWLDADGDGVQDAGESGLEGATVRLYDGSGTILLAATVTDENGHYAFGNLPVSAGGVTYQVQVVPSTLPAGLTQTYDATSPTTDNKSTVTLTTTTPVRLDQDFGYRGLNTIEGTIWEDSNADGHMDGEEGDYFGGVTVVLYNSAGNIVATTTTDPTGNYQFKGLPDGTYTVDVTDDANVLNGYWKSDCPIANRGQDDYSQLDPYTVSVSGGTTNDTADFGYYVEPAAVGNWVWRDALGSSVGNGIQDAGEVGIPGVVVTLVITWPDNTTTTLKTTTDANGGYSFGNLLQDEDYNGAAGDGSAEPAFTITVTYPNTWSVSPQGQTDEEHDSDNPATEPANPIKGSSDDTNDFGFYGGPLGVALAAFTADATAGGVALAWETVSEQDTAGFNLYRSGSAEGPWAQLNEVLIASQAPGTSEGRAYTWTDATAEPGATYWYVLEDVALDSTATLHAPVSVTAGDPAGPNAVGLSTFGAVSPAAVSTAAGLAALGLAVLAGLGRRRK